MNKEDMIEMTVFCDSTELFTEDECNVDNLAYINFPRNIVQKYFDELCIGGRLDGLQINGHDITFEEWLEEYTADDTDDLYDFAIAEGYHPKRFDKGEKPETVHFRRQVCNLCFFENANDGAKTLNVGDFIDRKGGKYFYNCTLDKDGFRIELWYEDVTIDESHVDESVADPLTEEDRRFLEVLMRNIFDYYDEPEKSAA